MEYIIDGQEQSPEVFWGELAPCDHLVQMYEDDDVFLDSLEGFVSGGLRAGDATVIIATAAHLANLEERLQARGFQLDVATARDQYIALDAEETLAKFLVNGWPDDEKFHAVVDEILLR